MEMEHPFFLVMTKEKVGDGSFKSINEEARGPQNFNIQIILVVALGLSEWRAIETGWEDRNGIRTKLLTAWFF